MPRWMTGPRRPTSTSPPCCRRPSPRRATPSRPRTFRCRSRCRQPPPAPAGPVSAVGADAGEATETAGGGDETASPDDADADAGAEGPEAGAADVAAVTQEADRAIADPSLDGAGDGAGDGTPGDVASVADAPANPPPADPPGADAAAEAASDDAPAEEVEPDAPRWRVRPALRPEAQAVATVAARDLARRAAEQAAGASLVARADAAGLTTDLSVTALLEGPGARTRPPVRPAAVERAAARAAARREAAAASAAPAQVATRPAAPTEQRIRSAGGNVAQAATQQNVLSLRDLNLIGTYGQSSRRRALVRLPNGRYVRVEVGSPLDRGTGDRHRRRGAALPAVGPEHRPAAATGLTAAPSADRPALSNGSAPRRGVLRDASRPMLERPMTEFASLRAGPDAPSRLSPRGSRPGAGPEASRLAVPPRRSGLDRDRAIRGMGA